MLVLFIGLGVVALTAAVCNSDWFFQTGGADFFVRRLGRKGARIFYGVLGCLLIGCGVAGWLCW